MLQTNHKDLHLNYFGGSGGFLALHLLLLSNHYSNELNNQLNIIIDHQWRITDHSKWKCNETWPNNNRTLSMPGSPKLFFYCSHIRSEWEKLSGIKLLIYTDLASQLALCNYKKSWVHNTNFTHAAKDLNVEFGDFYNNVKDSTWPDCTEINDSKNLPEHIQHELLTHVDYVDFINATSWDHWFVMKQCNNKIDNNIVFSEVADVAKHSDLSIKLQDIVNTNGTALLAPLGLPVLNQHVELIKKWK
jgi:hypothetical protein